MALKASWRTSVRGWLVGAQEEVRARPDPLIELELRANIPAWLIRLAAGAAMVAACTALASMPGHLVFALLAGIAVAATPNLLGVILALCYVGIALFTRDTALIDDGAWRVGVMVACAHASALLTAYAADLGAKARIEWAALTPGLRRWLVIEVFVQLVALVAAAALRHSVTVPALIVIAMALVLALVWFTTSRLPDASGAGSGHE